MKVRYSFYTVCFIGVFLVAWAFWFEPASLFNEGYELSIPQWPKTCSGTRIAVLADLHVGSPFNGLEKLDRIIELTQTAQPDLILLAGDYVIHGIIGGEFTPPKTIAKRLADLSAPLGVYAVLGNHDWWLNAARVRRALEAVGITVLEDTSVPIRSGRCEFWLAGISDFWEGPHDIRKALAEVPAGASILVFTHNPDVFPEIPQNVALTVAGHTHGGQVYIPLIGRPVVPSNYGERYAIGHVVEEGRHLFVSSGLGTSILPVRFFVPPEVSILTVRSDAS